MSLTCRRWLTAVAIVVGLGLSGRGVAVVQAQEDAPAATRVVEAPRDESSKSFLGWMIEASGPIGVIIVAMSFYLIAVVTWMTLQYRKTVAIPAGLVREVSALLAEKNFAEAYQRLAADSSFFARVLGAGLRKLPSGTAPALRAMELANEDATMEMEHRTTYLATIGTLGPMIGLVGTVYGMIRSFQVIATAGTSPQASQLAAGISTALFATLEGIAVSIPAIFFFALFRNRIARLSLEVALTSEALLEQFGPGIRGNPHPLVASSTPTVARSALPSGEN